MIKLVKQLFVALATVYSMSALSETIIIQTPYSASHSGTPALISIINEANRIQNNYQFVLEFKPGANQLLAVRPVDASPQNTLAVVAASIVENHEQNRLNIADYVPIFSLGDACWMAMTTAGGTSVKDFRADEITVGTVGFGNATHLTALEIGEQRNIPVRLIPFKSNYDAVINMAGSHGVNFGIDRVEVFESLATRNRDLKMLGASCPKRLPSAPTVATLEEQGIRAPSVFNTVVSHVQMDVQKQKALGTILNQAVLNIGEDAIFKSSGFLPAVFLNQTASQHFNSRVQLIKTLRNKHRAKISSSN